MSKWICWIKSSAGFVLESKYIFSAVSRETLKNPVQRSGFKG
jgi:hypothetical protein